MASPEQPPLPLLFLIGDTGGGHRSAAAAVQQSLERLLPGRFAPVICDPLRGPDVPGLLRWFAGLYGLCIRLTPWLWWSFWRTSNSPFGLRLLRRTIMAPVYGSVERAVEASRPALIVAFHPMTADPAVRARRITGMAAPAITVVTDLVTAHLSWVDGGARPVRSGRPPGRPLRAARAAGRGRVLPPAARRGAAARAQTPARAPRRVPRRAPRRGRRGPPAGPRRRRDPAPGGGRGRGRRRDLRPQPLAAATGRPPGRADRGRP